MDCNQQDNQFEHFFGTRGLIVLFSLTDRRPPQTFNNGVAMKRDGMFLEVLIAKLWSVVGSHTFIAIPWTVWSSASKRSIQASQKGIPCLSAFTSIPYFSG